MAEFDVWWRASKYCQVVNPEPHWEQIARDAWAARGLAAEQDAVKARALEAWVTAQRAINASWQTDDLYNHDKQNALLLAGKLAHDAAFALCPASTKEGA